MGTKFTLAAAGLWLLASCSDTTSQQDSSGEPDARAGNITECPASAGACPSECFAISGSEVVGDCSVTSAVIGCVSEEPEVVTLDVACVRRTGDGAEFIVTSGTFAELLIDSGNDWQSCTGYVPPCDGPP